MPVIMQKNLINIVILDAATLNNADLSALNNIN